MATLRILAKIAVNTIVFVESLGTPESSMPNKARCLPFLHLCQPARRWNRSLTGAGNELRSSLVELMLVRIGNRSSVMQAQWMRISMLEQRVRSVFLCGNCIA